MRKCAICGKTYNISITLKKLRGKYNPTAKKRRYPNLQWVRLPSGVKPREGHAPLREKRVKACAKCIKAMTKEK